MKIKRLNESVYEVTYLRDREHAYRYHMGSNNYEWTTTKVTADSKEEAKKIVLKNNPDGEVLSVESEEEIQAETERREKSRAEDERKSAERKAKYAEREKKKQAELGYNDDQYSAYKSLKRAETELKNLTDRYEMEKAEIEDRIASYKRRIGDK